MNSTFQKLINSEQPVLLDFHAEWCGPCKAMNPTISTLAKKWKGQVKVIKIDIDKNQDLASKLSIKGVPTIMVYQNGMQKWRESGVRSLSEIDKVLSSLMS